MRPLTIAAVLTGLSALPVTLRSSDKLTFDERVELVRGLTAEYATVKQFLPRSKKPLEYESSGNLRQEEVGRDRQADGPGGAHRRPGADH